MLPYLAAILVGLLAYVVYTRVVQTPAPVAVSTVAPVEVSPTPAVTPSPQATQTPRPAAAAPLPARPVGRGNPFVPLVVPPTPTPAPAQRPAPPPLPAVPPPVFPTETPPPAAPPSPPPTPSPGPSPTPAPPAARLLGVLLQVGDTERLAIVQVGQKSYIVRVGDIVEGLRVIRIEQDEVVFRHGETELSVTFPTRETSVGGERP